MDAVEEVGETFGGAGGEEFEGVEGGAVEGGDGVDEFHGGGMASGLYRWLVCWMILTNDGGDDMDIDDV